MDKEERGRRRAEKVNRLLGVKYWGKQEPGLLVKATQEIVPGVVRNCIYMLCTLLGTKCILEEARRTVESPHRSLLVVCM